MCGIGQRPPVAESMENPRARKVLMGTCGWSDQTLLRCGKFYPASVRSAEDRLQHYSAHFPCVEVDTSTYAIPPISSIKRWIQSVPQGFLFHFKAFGLFCSKSCPIAALPAIVRSRFSSMRVDHVQLDSIPASSRDEIWQIFNNSLEPVHEAGHLGVVVFQFHLSFKPSEGNKRHVLWCRRHLDARYSMAVEFRCREWVTGHHASSTVEWLKNNELALIAADELEHETYQKDRHQIGLLEGKTRAILPIAWFVTQPNFMYIRVHRREGNQRILSQTEILEWEARLRGLLDHFMGEIYFMWGTDWEDQPLINAKNLSNNLADAVFDWKVVQRMTTKGSLYSLFRAASKLPESSFSDEASKVYYPGRECNIPANEFNIPHLQKFADKSPDADLQLLNQNLEFTSDNTEGQLNLESGLITTPLKAFVTQGTRARKRAIGLTYDFTVQQPKSPNFEEGIEIPEISISKSLSKKKLQTVSNTPKVSNMRDTGTLMSFFKRVS
ncbi:hypothetical protein O6H91_18G061600 [Diphasiastrum complanatum]|uniref:Uncharacterized protein n=1 Tax=Diphasiastrum complanatum TaxID=34168 RepID=A0ACC2B1W1_DIPCM|nr:hypothetical protein O6H91_18G061600 [Diphasiastrum complanatum]